VEDFEIRIAVTNELAVIAAFRRTWDMQPDAPNPVEGAAAFDERFSEWFRGERNQRTLWIAWSADKPVGLTALLEYRAMPTPNLPERCWGYLGNMYVAAAHRNHGLGSRLLEIVLAAADERGYRRVVLAPSPRSIPFYRRAGFIDAGPQADGDRIMVRPAPQRQR
jgi:GNAT superfamily N-acetyltransferase